jgi:hypothetical protein
MNGLLVFGLLALLVPLAAAECGQEQLLLGLHRVLIYESSSSRSQDLAPWLFLSLSLMLNFILIIRR